MNDELQSKLTEILTQLQSELASGKEFVGEQAPLVAQEYLTYYWWYYLLVASAWFVLSVATLICLVVVLKLTDNLKDIERDTAKVGSTILFVGFSILALMTGVNQGVFPLLKVHLAPRVFILEKIGGLM